MYNDQEKEMLERETAWTMIWNRRCYRERNSMDNDQEKEMLERETAWTMIRATTGICAPFIVVVCTWHHCTNL